MITRPLFSAAALALGLLATAPAMAGSTSHTQIIGYDNEVEVSTRDGAQLGAYVEGDGNTVEDRVAGPGSRVVTANIGHYTTTQVDVRGYGNQVGTMAGSGSSVAARVRGDDNQGAHYARHGSRVSSSVKGDGNYIRTDAR